VACSALPKLQSTEGEPTHCDVTSPFVTNGQIDSNAFYYMLNMGTPEDRNEAIERAKGGELIDITKAREIVVARG